MVGIRDEANKNSNKVKNFNKNNNNKKNKNQCGLRLTRVMQIQIKFSDLSKTIFRILYLAGYGCRPDVGLHFRFRSC